MTQNPRTNTEAAARIGVDIGGTFTDVALESRGRRWTAKVLTTPRSPETGVMEALGEVLQAAGLSPGDIGLIVHGTTLATNGLIERKGARTAFLTTAGFRDSLQLRQEGRFDQYDVMIDLPEPLVPCRLRLPVTERMAADGTVLTPLDEDSVRQWLPTLDQAGVEAVAVGFLHSYANPAHERRVRDILSDARPALSVSLSAEVSPEIREYDRFSTVCANAYVQPMIERYLTLLETLLRETGYTCPLLMMLSGGGLGTVDIARRFPIRIVESGPAGGAIFAGQIARQCGLEKVISFDMGGTTAKLCLIDGGRPQTSRMFEVARMWRFRKGSGLPLRIPVVEMVEIGAGGGSIAHLDTLGRLTVGPESAGADPGPAAYGRGGTEPTVTDADVRLGRIDPARFSDGRIALLPEAAEAALANTIGGKLGITGELAAAAVSEMVDETMANAARVHAAESGKDLTERTMIVFGGAAPLHAARVARKLGIRHFIVPAAAGVGSAVGFLRAPIAYEIVRSLYQRLGSLDVPAVAGLLGDMREEAERFVRQAAPSEPLDEERLAFMRYVGQGHEVPVPVPSRIDPAMLADELKSAFERIYRQLYTRTIPNVDIEVMTWTTVVSTRPVATPDRPPTPPRRVAEPTGTGMVFDIEDGAWSRVPVYWRPDLAPGDRVEGPAVIAEPETSTVLSAGFVAVVDALGHLDCTATEGTGSPARVGAREYAT